MAEDQEWSDKNMEINKHDSVLALLTDMFGDVASLDLINDVCTNNNWEVESCIDQMIKHLSCQAEFQSDKAKNETPLSKQHQDFYNYLFANNVKYSSNVFNKEYSPFKMDGSNTTGFYTNDIKIEEENASNLMETRDFDPNGKYLGAVPKNKNTQVDSTEKQIFPPIDFSSIFKKGFKEFVQTPSNHPRKREASDSPKLESVIKTINKGYKLMVIMRGPPGAGKSYLARNIVDRTVKGDYRNHIFSTDDYFNDINDKYVFRPEKLQEAHDFNQKRVRKKAAEGWSPIIVDNTNIKTWEMIPYVKIAVRHGYIIELLEPDTEWAHSAGKLALKNRHGVAKDKIEKMLNNFEPMSVPKLLLMTNEKYEVQLPQLRHNPPLPLLMLCEETQMDSPTENDDVCTSVDAANIQEESSTSWVAYEDVSNENDANKELNSNPEPKPARNTPRKKRSIDLNEQKEIVEEENSPKVEDVEWKPYDEESSQFWNTSQVTTIRKTSSETSIGSTGSKPQRNLTRPLSVENTIFSILKDRPDVNSDANKSSTEKAEKKLERHKFGCKNESKSFVMIRQIYPNKQVDGLWDLFEKCNGDADWTIDILLKDDSCVDQDIAGCYQEEFFRCHCDENTGKTIQIENKSSENDLFKLPRQRARKDKPTNMSAELLEAKKAIEKQFVLGDEFYSNHVRKIRDIRHGIEAEEHVTAKEQPNTEWMWVDTKNKENTSLKQEEESVWSNVENKKNDEEDSSSEGDNDEMLEINLGKELIDQLENIFGEESGPKHNLPDLKTTNVFMPKNLAKQLYALWMESLYNQIEEQRQIAIKEDEEFARILGNPETYIKYPSVPNTFKEIMDMELAWTIYKSDKDNWKTSTPKDLASHLTQLKLCEIFPNIEKDTLMEILAAHGNNFAETVEVLKNSINCNFDEDMKNKKIELLEKAKDESSKKEDDQKTKKYTSPKKKALSTEELKKIALREFEECRNYAVHHSQLKAECYQKARDAIQKGNTAVAVYYSQIANLHKNKIDMYNHRAANCIMQVNDLTQNNPDFIDLHYLHVIEALSCLDVFIDKHITKIKGNTVYKHIFIITGRGLHSVGGVSTIKNNVKARLKERNLKWSEVNPGLLKVKIFSASKYSKNVY